MLTASSKAADSSNKFSSKLTAASYTVMPLTRPLCCREEDILVYHAAAEKKHLSTAQLGAGFVAL
jgi:hypothetical protein